MNHTRILNIAGGVVIAIGGFLLLGNLFKNKKKDSKGDKTGMGSSQDNAKDKSMATAFKPITLDSIKNKPFVIKNREKFFDEWAAEEGGVQSIRDMYAKSPTKFSEADLYYLRSKGILPRLDFENIKPKGITTT
jgi:hypothetical protein